MNRKREDIYKIALATGLVIAVIILIVCMSRCSVKSRGEAETTLQDTSEIEEMSTVEETSPIAEEESAEEPTEKSTNDIAEGTFGGKKETSAPQSTAPTEAQGLSSAQPGETQESDVFDSEDSNKQESKPEKPTTAPTTAPTIPPVTEAPSVGEPTTADPMANTEGGWGPIC